MQVNCIIRDRMRMVLWVAMIRSVCASVYMRTEGNKEWVQVKGRKLAAGHDNGWRRRIPARLERLDRILLGILGRILHC